MQYYFLLHDQCLSFHQIAEYVVHFTSILHSINYLIIVFPFHDNLFTFYHSPDSFAISIINYSLNYGLANLDRFNANIMPPDDFIATHKVGPTFTLSYLSAVVSENRQVIKS